MNISEIRQTFRPRTLKILEDPKTLRFLSCEDLKGDPEIKKRFPKTFGKPLLKGEKTAKKAASKPLKLGVVFSGGQAPGGHNVIAGLYDALKNLHTNSQLFGFLGGPKGIVQNLQMELTDQKIQPYRNQGGFDLIGSGRDKIESKEDLDASQKTCIQLDLDGLVIIGGDDSNTNAALLAEHFLENGCKTTVVGVPKTIDGDLQSKHIPMPFGFDTATKVYSEMIGNILRDALSAKKYYHFIRLMGRSASHVTLECALKTQPNLTLISEECLNKRLSLMEIVDQIAEMIEKRAEKEKYYGAVLIPEGLLEFIPEIKDLIQAINKALAKNPEASQVEGSLPQKEKELFHLLPPLIKEQLLLDRDPHGNVQVSRIATELLLISMVEKKLNEKVRKKFHAISHFFGYEGRAALPTNFDANYCYNLGRIAAGLITDGHTGYLAACGNLEKDLDEWVPKGVPITMMMNMELRKGKEKPVIRKTLVDFESNAYKSFTEKKERLKWDDAYRFPGPIQFEGPKELVDAPPLLLKKNAP